jgi:hypothetical protein
MAEVCPDCGRKECLCMTIKDDLMEEVFEEED